MLVWRTIVERLRMFLWHGRALLEKEPNSSSRFHGGVVMRRRFVVMALGVLFVVGMGRMAAAVDDRLDACGTWQHYTVPQLSRSQCPPLRGRLIKANWADLESNNDVWDWTSLETPITEAADAGIYAGIMIHTGMAAPEWLYTNGVPKVMTTGKQLDGRLPGPYPYYFDPEYKVFFKRMIHKVYERLTSLPRAQRNRVIFVQAAFGTTGDEGPWKGAATDPQYEIDGSGPEWVEFNKEMLAEYYNLYKNTNPRIYLLCQGGNSADLLPGLDEWQEANCPGSWRKNGHLNQGYQLNEEVKRMDWLIPIINARQQGAVVRSRSEQSMTREGWWQAAPLWNQWTVKLEALHCGLDFAMHDASGELTEPSKWPIFEFFNRYAGRKYPEISPGAFCGMHDGLDASDTTRFPEAKYGEAARNNQQRYLSIAMDFSSRGAGQDDPALGTASPMLNRRAKGLNDVGWGIFAGNYDKFLSQYDPNATSIGWWRVGSTSEMYGRFARGFEHSTGRDAMCFDIDDGLFGGVLVNGAYPITVRVVYFDSGSGSWELRYDSTTGDKQALSVTKTNTGKWKEATATLTDAHFGNRCEHGTDFCLRNTDAEDDIFSFIEVTKPTAASFNAEPRFKADPFLKRHAVKNVDYWTAAYQQIDLDAFDPNAEKLTFSKISGPAWLTVNADGDLGGAPGDADVGNNAFTVRVTDGAGLKNDATLNITVDSQQPPSAPAAAERPSQ